MNKADVINKIIAGYASGLNAQRTAIAAGLQAARADAAFAALETELNALYIERGRLLSAPPSTRSPQLKEGKSELLNSRIAALEKQYADRIKARGIRHELQYRCQKCKDTGWADGCLCPCVKQRLHDELAAKSGLNLSLHDFSDADMEAFPPENREGRKDLYARMKTYCEKFPDAKYRNLFFSGNVGSGKTFLASCIANELLKKGKTVQLLTSFAFGNQMLKAHLAPLDERDDLIAPLLETDLLILDDLGAEPLLKNVTVEYLYLVLNERLTTAKHTVLTTNLSPADFLARYESRVCSRAMDKKSTYRAYMDGPDLRLNASGATAK
jgi:DNA replication protein DnaC